MGKTSIEWAATKSADGTFTAGKTWNPVRGCVKVSPGCKHCYAETFAERWRGIAGHPYEQGFDPRLVPGKLGEPLSWRKPCTVFVNSMSDLFGDFVPDDYVDRVFGVMWACRYLGRDAVPGHTFQVLTKRADRMSAYMATDRRAAWASAAAHYGGGYDPDGLHDSIAFEKEPHPRVHLGVSVEDRKYGLPRIDHLRGVPAALRFLSIEPLLEDLGEIDLTGIGWVIVGGESGRGSRPMNEDWVRSIRDQCQAQGVPFFYKQRIERGRKVSLPVIDGRSWAEMPVLRGES